jgi:hypothetical protein
MRRILRIPDRLLFRLRHIGGAWNDEHRAVSVLQNVIRESADEQALVGAVVIRAENDQIGSAFPMGCVVWGLVG